MADYLVLVSGYRVRRPAASSDPGLCSRCVHMRVSEGIVATGPASHGRHCTRNLPEIVVLLHVVIQGFECSFQVPRVISIRIYLGVVIILSRVWHVLEIHRI